MAIDQVIRINAGQHARIAEAAKQHGVSASEEVRFRLDITLKADEATTLLTLRIIRLAQLQDRGGHGVWSKSPEAFAIFRDAILTLIDSQKPGGEPVDVPAAISATLANITLSEKVEP